MNKKKMVDKIIKNIDVIVDVIKRYKWIQNILKIIMVILFINLFIFAEYKGKLVYLIYRIVLFIIIMIILIIIKFYYYIIRMPYLESNIKEFFRRNKKINKIGLIIIKWTNIVYIYNDILLIIIILMQKVRSSSKYFIVKIEDYMKNMDENEKDYYKIYKYVVPYRWSIIYYYLDIMVYKIFYIIIKIYIIELVSRIKKMKKRFIEIDIQVFIKRRLVIWVIMTYIIIYFAIVYNIKYMIMVYLIYILIRVYNKIKMEIILFDKYEDAMSGLNNSKEIVELNIKTKKIYEEYKETIYILKNCDIEEEYDMRKINMYATSKIIDEREWISDELRMDNDNYYWYQHRLYFFEFNKELIGMLVNKILVIMKITILSILRIEKEIELRNKKNENKEKEYLVGLKESYINNLKKINEFFSILKEGGMECDIILYDIVEEGNYKIQREVKKKIEIKFNYYEKQIGYKIKGDELYKKYEECYKSILRIEKKEYESKYEYYFESKEIMKSKKVGIMSYEYKNFMEDEYELGKLIEEEYEEYLEEIKEYEDCNYYIVNFKKYGKEYLNNVCISGSRYIIYENNVRSIQFDAIIKMLSINNYSKKIKTYIKKIKKRMKGEKIEENRGDLKMIKITEESLKRSKENMNKIKRSQKIRKNLFFVIFYRYS